MYRDNRPIWLKYSKANKKRFPNRVERYNAFLRESYEGAKPFSNSSMGKVIEELGLQIPIDKLVKYGEERNWLTKDGKPYQNVQIFCTVWNGVWLAEQRRNSKAI